MFSKIFNKLFKKKMPILDIQFLHEQYSQLQFQWIKTERLGEICQYKNIDTEGEDVWINFTDGSRINSELINDYILTMPKEDFKNPPLPPKDRIIKEGQEPPKPKSLDNPIQALLKKQKPNIQSVSLDISVNLPSKELYTILHSSFEDADDQITQYILDNLDIDAVKKSIIESIKNIHYK